MPIQIRRLSKLSKIMETVLLVGATGNIGTSAAIGALKSGRKVLAIVRNDDSAKRLIHNVGTSEGITTVQGDVMSDTGVQSVVDQVRAGKLPAFQHVYAAAGGSYAETPLTELDTKSLRDHMQQNFESNFFAYRATVPYLLEQKNPNSTWTLCTGAQGFVGMRAAPAMSQGALFSMAYAASRDNLKTNVRFNEVLLALRVEVDESAEKHGVMKASEFAKNFEQILDSPDVRSSRVIVESYADLDKLRYTPKKDLQY